MPALAIPPSELLTPPETAQFLRSKATTLQRWRSGRTGPPFVKIGRRVVYRRDDLESWLARQRQDLSRIGV